MFKSVLTAVFCCFLVACGPSFAGKWAGGLSYTGSCSDGSVYSGSDPTEWVITERGGLLTITTQGSCSPLQARVSGQSASLAQKTCPTVTAPGGTATGTFTGGSLSLNEPLLIVSITESVAFVFTGGGAGSCNTTYSANFARQPG